MYRRFFEGDTVTVTSSFSAAFFSFPAEARLVSEALRGRVLRRAVPETVVEAREEGVIM